MTSFTIDVDAEAVFLEGAWYTREDLSRRIRAMLDQGDFNIAMPSAALQDLTQVLQGVRTLAFRVTPDMADALQELAARTNQTVGFVIREAVTQFITDANSAPPDARAPVLASPIPLQVTTSTGTTKEDLPAVMDARPLVIAGPGAMRAAEPSPVDLVHRKHQLPGDS